MSVVRIVKDRQERRALIDALNAEPRKKCLWWEQKEKVLQQWLSQNSDDLRVEGAIDLIVSQLTRGNSHTHLRIKCWKHIVIELASLLEEDTDTNTQRRASSAASAPKKEYANESDTPVDLSQMSFLKRQEIWLKRRKSSMIAKSQQAVEDDENATFAPNVQPSQNSMKTSQMAAMEKKMELMALESERVVRRKQLERERKKERNLKQFVLPITFPSKSDHPVSGNLGFGIKQSTKKSRKHCRRNSAPEFFNDSKVKNTDSNIVEESDDGSVTETDNLFENAQVNLSESNSSSEPHKSAFSEKSAFEPGSFYSKIDDRGRGHYRVRDPCLFQLTTMYKRKDRVTRTMGVSLLVGRLELPPHEEQVVTAIFDGDRFTEESACTWWEVNGHRFEDGKCKEQREEMDRKTEEHEKIITSLALRRTSAPAILSGSSALQPLLSPIKSNATIAQEELSVPQSPTKIVKLSINLAHKEFMSQVKDWVPFSSRKSYTTRY